MTIDEDGAASPVGVVRLTVLVVAALTGRSRASGGDGVSEEDDDDSGPALIEDSKGTGDGT